MIRFPRSLLAFRMARLATLEYVVSRLMREHLRRAGQSAADVPAYAEQARRHFAAHPPLGIPAPEMVAAIDLFFNALAADMRTEATNAGQPT
jgi:hypothetical protein